MKERVLVIEDSRLMSKVLGHYIRSSLGLEPVMTDTYAAAKTAVEASEQLSTEQPFLAAIADLNLPDAPNGESVDLVTAHKIPTIVLTSTYSEEKRSEILAKGVVDYVTKENRASYEYVMRLIHRLDANRFVEALIVDDGKVDRKFIRRLLELKNFVVHEAEDGVAALEMLAQHPKIKLVISDYNMPRMDGFALSAQLRRDYDMEQLAIIGLSSADCPSVSARFLKCGANDFLVKPFSHEEFFIRIMQNMDAQEYLANSIYRAQHDDLTGLYTWRYFNEHLDKVLGAKETVTGCVCVVELDDARRIKEMHGYEVYDLILKAVADEVRELDPNGLAARLGGTEFIVFLPETDMSSAEQLTQTLIDKVFNQPVEHESLEIEYTVSIGVAEVAGGDVKAIIHDADQALHQAQDAGGNQVRVF